MTPLSVLDLFPIGVGTAPSQAIHDGVALARRVDELGYTRYWIAEHHNMPSIASSSPEVLIGHIAGATKRIRVGAGGIMVPNHAPLRVVEIFRTLEALHPGRIDLGLGRAPGTDPLTSSALRRRGEVNEQLAELVAFARGDFPAGHPFADIVAMPSDVAFPPMFMLGSTDAGALLGAGLGVRYAFAGHFAMVGARDAMRLYRARFRPSKELAKPHAILAVTVICGDDDAHADYLAGPMRVAVANLRTGRKAAFASFEEAKNRRFSPVEEAVIGDFLSGALIGSVETVRRGLEALIEDTAADEVMVSTLIPSLDERVRSYERVATLMP